MTGYDRVLMYMQEHGSITRAEAFTHIGVANLTAAIDVLRHKRNINVITTMVEKIGMYGSKVRYARYILGSNNEPNDN